MRTAYLIGPMTGLTFADCREKFERLEHAVRHAGLDVLQPMQGKHRSDDALVTARGNAEGGPSCDHAIYRKDAWAVEQADILLCDLTGHERVSIGTCFELAWGARAGKLIIIVGLEDDTPMDHAFIHGASSLRFDRMGEALDYLRAMTGAVPPAWTAEEDNQLIQALTRDDTLAQTYDRLPLRSCASIRERVESIAAQYTLTWSPSSGFLVSPDPDFITFK